MEHRMKLYSGPLSLFSHKVEIALREKGLAFERIMVPFNQTVGYSPKHPDVLAHNPKGQVPVIIDKDLALYDSTVIFEYLEEAYPAPALYPVSPAERARCRLYDVFADEVMLVPLRALMHRTGPRPPEPEKWTESEDKAKEAILAIDEHFATLNEALGDREYLCGAFSVADISVFMAALFSERLGGPSLKPHVSLLAWYRRLKARDAFARIAAEVAAADRALSQTVAGAYSSEAG